MKIIKYVASALVLAAMTFSFSSCTNDNDVVDSKANYLFEFAIAPGGLTEAQLQELNDSIDSKIYGSVGATHNPLYSTLEYALKNYDLAAADDSLFLNGIVNPIADKYNVLDFAVTMRMKDADGNVLRENKVYAPNVQRADYALNVKVDGGTLAAEDAEGLKASILNLFTEATTINSTKGYALNKFLSEKASEIQTLSDNLADAKDNDSFIPTLTVASTQGVVASSQDFAPRYDYVEQYVVTVQGGLSDDAVEELESDLRSTVFDGVSYVNLHSTKANASKTFDLNITKKNVAIQRDVINAIASKYNVSDFVVEMQLVDRNDNVVILDGVEKTVPYSPVITRNSYSIKYEIVQGSLTANGLTKLTTQIKEGVFANEEAKTLGEVTEGYASVQFSTFNNDNATAIQSVLTNIASNEDVKVTDCKVIIKLVKTVGGTEEAVNTKEYTL